MNKKEFSENLKKAQEKKGFYFNFDIELVADIVDGLFENKQRYGYPSCPCRLAFGKIEKDRAIICPCQFRDEDVKFYGRCFCNLFVAKDSLSDKKIIAESVPERWYRE